MTMSLAVTDTQPVDRLPRRPRWRRLLRPGPGLVAGVFLLCLAVATTGARWLAPADPEEQDLGAALAGPSGAHWLGTDRLGRDVLSRLLHGGQVTLVSVVEAVAVFVVLGVTLGVTAGYLGGWADRAISWLADLLLALPGIIMLLMVLAVFPGNTAATMVVLGVISAPMLLRVTRGVTMSVKQELYVRAARLSGLGEVRIMTRHVLPRLTGPILVQVSLFAATAVLVQGALSFLGLSAPETEGPSWGNMIAQAAQVTSQDLWLAIPTGALLTLTVLALGLFGDAIRDATAGHRAPAAPLRPVRSTAPAVPPRPAEGPAPLLSVDGLTIGFPGPDGPVTVVRDVSFTVAPGECVGVIGESGSGKTMIARSLLGLLPAGGAVTAGAATLHADSGPAVELTRLDERGFGRVRGCRIALVSQEPSSSLDPAFRVGSQVAEVIRRHTPMSRRQAAREAIELLRTVRLPEPERVARRYPHELSGGMAQRVVIALALAGKPSLLVADEPTTALDVTVQAEILALLRDLQRRLGMAVILVTHDWGVLADLCDRAVVVYAGEVVEQAGVADLYTGARHPYTRSLLAADPHLAEAGQDLPTIAGTVPSPRQWSPGCRFRPRCGVAVDDCAIGRIPLTVMSDGRVARCIRADEVVKR
ncbi:dipeptide/oligopeptide/nickel ABC transporter permease/ATP-binding protein [Dactylosporangium fulvum]|uniref:Dipeptide/oligopeptide/nickel ABC transporter permease/ATP-binding protein n=1 Tax=Dactylosporangium fulvum TaxID=53359 RepID=A0ABY5W6T0_9ACTN|nr:dipeptide/oligopeptide/nickel ABC transporter permease/ATP-binding protein [Dactylosporangium fulvum]UWP85242.1 dipeptide/oligopeptide/nickel ABC transporter permease/ATP-binding protein [Dactylosporangium fulvum]